MTSTSTSSTIPRTSFCALFNILNSGDSRSFAEICLTSCVSHCIILKFCVFLMYCILVKEIYSSLDDPICIRQIDFDSPKAATAGVPHDAVVVSLLQRRPLHSSTVPSCSLRRRLVWSFNDEPEWVLSAQQQAKDGCLHVSIVIDYSALLRMECYHSDSFSQQLG